jgi:WD40 repeat protein
MYGSAQPPSTMLSSSQDGTVRLWSLDTYTNLVVYRGHGRDPVWDVEWGPMGVYFASASRDRTAKLWSSDRVSPLRIYTGHLSDVNVSSESSYHSFSYLASDSRAYTPRDGRRELTQQCVKFHPNSLYLATGSNDNSCRLWQSHLTAGHWPLQVGSSFCSDPIRQFLRGFGSFEVDCLIVDCRWGMLTSRSRFYNLAVGLGFLPRNQEDDWSFIRHHLPYILC